MATDEVGAIGTPVSVPKAGELIAQALRRQIVRGELKAGDLLPTEQELMQQFRVSRPTLREASRILESESLIAVRRGARSRVNIPDIEVASRHVGLLFQVRKTALADVYDARMLIEPPLVRSLAESHQPEDIGRLRAHLDYEAAHLADLEVFAAATARFHELLVSPSGNDALVVFATLLDDIFRRHVVQSVERTKGDVDYPALNQQALANHIKVVDHVEAGEADEAEAFWRAHMATVRPYVFLQFDEATVVDLYV